MKICQTHWDKLKELLDQHDLSKFIAKNSENAAKILIQELKGEHKHPDPLLICNNMIWQRSIETFGLGIMQENCPCCYANVNYPDKDGEPTGDYWIRTLVPYVKTMFEEKGLFNIN